MDSVYKFSWYRRIWLSLAAFLFNLSAIAFFGSSTLNFPVLGITIITLTANKQTAFLWALITGITMELFSPFPMLVYFLAILLVFIGLRVFIINYMSNRTIFGAIASSLLGVLCFEIILKALAYFGSLINQGWIPIINQDYLVFLLNRLFFNALIVFLIFFILRQFSAQARGVAIHNIRRF